MSATASDEVEAPGLIGRLLEAFVRRVGRVTLLTWGLLLVLVSSLAFGLADLVRGVDLGFLLPTAVLASLAGWILGGPQIRRWRTVLYAALIGNGWVFYQVGVLGGPLYRLARALDEAMRFYLAWPPHALLPEGEELRQAAQVFASSVGALAGRFISWLAALPGGQAGYDPAALAVLWGLAVWAVSAWAGWAARQERPLQAALPPAGLLAAALAFAGSSTALLLPLLLVTFLLMALIYYQGRERFWDTHGIDFSEDMRLENAMVIVGVAISLTTLAIISPSFRLQRVVDFFRQFNEPEISMVEPVGESLGLERRTPTPMPAALELRRRGGLPRDHLLGAGPELSQQVVLRISTGDLPPGSAGAGLASAAPRYYWRGLTYDGYNGRGWYSTPIRILDYASGASTLGASPRDLPRQPGQRLIRQTVEAVGVPAEPGKPAEAGALLYAAGELLAAEPEYQASWRTRPGAEGEPQALLAAEPTSQFDLFGATVGGGSYRASSLFSTPGEDELRQAGSQYPEWVRERYLQLPERLPTRVRSLARDLTATAATPYDQAKAIEQYLRTFPYNLDISAPPGSRDVADYFLFDLQQGYCDYYATAMVVLARAAGVPARLAIGYASGSYDAYAAQYIITAADAHSWPEVYFPGYGWVAFEPTAGQPALEHTSYERTAGSTSAIEEGEPEIESPSPPAWWDSFLQMLAWAAGLLALGGLVVLTGWATESWRLRQMSPTAAMTAIYRRLYRRGQELDTPHRPGDTPLEFAAAVARRALSLARGHRLEPPIAPAPQETQQIADLYAAAEYSERAPTEAEQQEAIRLWQKLRWRLWLAQWLRQFRR